MAFTAEQLAEKLAQEREKIEQGIARHCPVPVFTACAEGRWVSANEPMQRLMAQSEGQLSGDRWLMRVEPDMLETVERDYQQVFGEKVPSAKLFIRFRAADQRRFDAFISMVRIGSCYVGFLVPACSNPVECPVHGFLLHNINGDAKKV